MAKYERTRLTAGDRIRVNQDGVISEFKIKEVGKNTEVLAMPFGAQPTEAAKPRKRKGQAEATEAAKAEDLIVKHASRAEEGEPSWHAFNPKENLSIHGDVFHIEHITV